MAITKEFKLKVTVEGDKKDFVGLTGAAKDYAAGVQKLSDNLMQVGKAAKSNALLFTELNSAIELGKKAFDLLAMPVNKAMTAFIEAEKAQTGLRNSLVALGFDAEGAMADLERFASEIQRTTTMSDDMALELASVGKALGLTNEQTKTIIKTSIGLSTAIGVDVRTAFNDLTGQLNGVAGRTSKYIAGLKDLTEEQLKAGEGIKLTATQFEKFATLSAGTLSGSIAQAKNAFEDIFEETGRVISSLIDLPNAARAATQAFIGITDSVKDFGNRLGIIKQEIAAIPFNELIASITAVGVALGGAAIAMNIGAIGSGLGALLTTIKAITTATLLAAAEFIAMAAAIMGVILAVDFLIANFDKLQMAGDVMFKSIGVALSYIKLGFATLFEFILTGVRSVLQSMSGFPGVASNLITVVDASLVTLKQQSAEAKEQMSGLTEEVSTLTDKIFSKKGVKTGTVLSGLLKGIEAVKKGFGAVTIEGKKTNAVFDDMSKFGQHLGPSLKEAEKAAKELESKIKDVVQEIKNLEKQTEALNIEEEKRGKTLVEIARIEEKYALLASENLRKRLKDLGVEDKQLENIIDNYNRAVKVKANYSAIDAQTKMDKEAADKRKATMSEIEKGGPIGAVVGAAILNAGEVIQDIMKGASTDFGKMFEGAADFLKKNFEEMNTEQLQQLAIMSSQMFLNWRGFIAGIGAAIGFSINNLDALFRASGDLLAAGITKGGELLEDNFNVLTKEYAAYMGAELSTVVKEMDWALEEVFGEATENFAAAFGLFGQWMGQVLDSSIQFLGNILSGDYLNKFVEATETIANFPNALLESFTKLEEILTTGAAKFTEATVKLLDKLPKIIALIGAELPKILGLFAQALPVIMRGIVNALPTILQAVLDVIPQMISSLGQVVVMFIELLPGMVDQIAKALPRIITQIFETLPRIFQALFRMIPALIENIAENIDEIVLAFVEGFISAMGEIVGSFIDEFILGGGLERVLGAIMRAIPRIIIALLQGIVRGVVKAIKGIINGTFGDIELPDSLKDLPKNIEKAADKLGKKLSRDASQLFTVKNLEETVKALSGATPYEKQAEFIEQASRKAGDSIGGMLGEWLNKLANIFGGIVTMFKDIASFFVSSLELLGTTIMKGWTGLIYQMIDAGKRTFEPIGLLINKFGGVLVEAANKLLGGMPMMGEQIFVGLRNSMFGEGSIFTEAGKKIWDGLSKGFENPINGLGALLNSLNPANLLSKMFNIGTSNKGDVEGILSSLTGKNIDVPFAEFAKGGMVGGQALVGGDSALNDRILALLSPGEAVIPRSLMADPFVKNLIDMVLAGDITPPAFKNGGLAKITSAASSAGGAISAAGKDAASSATEIAKHAGGVASDEYKKAIEWLAQFDPAKLWQMLKEKGVASMDDMLLNSKFHDGGIIGGSGDVPILGQAGEFVVNRRSTQANKPLLNQINSGAAIGGGGFIIENLTINAKTNLDAEGIRREVIPAIEKHLKRRSQDGEFVLSARGIRDK